MTFFDSRRRPFQWLPLLILAMALWTLAGCGGGGGGGGGGGSSTPVQIAGTLQDTKTGIKLGGYVVTVQGTALAGTTGTAAASDLGVFAISGVTPGNINLVVTDTCGHTIGSPVAVTVGTSASAGTAVNIGTVKVDLSSNPPAPCF